MPFGLSFGINKSKSKSTTDVDRTDTSTQATTGAQSTTGTTTQATTGSTNTTQSGTSDTNTTGSTTGTSTGSQSSTQTSTLFGDSVLGGLEGAVSQLLGAIPARGDTTMGGSFDHDAFIASGMDAASSRVTGDLEGSLNSLYDQFGGRDDSNSMVTLLANRARGDAGASLAGARGTLEAQAQGIERDRFLANLQGQASNQGYLNTVLSALRGGRSTTTGEVLTAEQQAQQNQQASGTRSNTSGSEATQSNSTSTQQLLELLSQMVNGTTHTVGTETTRSSGTNIGGGASASF